MTELNKMQAWVPGFYDKYYADIDGCIWRVRKTVAATEIKGYMNKEKYVVKLVKDGKIREQNKHKLIWLAFKKEIPHGYIVARKNGILKDVYLQNLVLRTKAEHGRLTGPRSRSKEVNSWRSARRAAKDLHCSYQTVTDICNNKRKVPIFNLSWADKTGKKRVKE